MYLAVIPPRHYRSLFSVKFVIVVAVAVFVFPYGAFSFSVFKFSDFILLIFLVYLLFFSLPPVRFSFYFALYRGHLSASSLSPSLCISFRFRGSCQVNFLFSCSLYSLRF